MESEQKKKIKIGVFCVIGFLLISFLVFRTSLPRLPAIFLYNLIIIASLQGLGFYRGVFFLGGAIFLTILLSFAADFYYVWNVPVFFITFLVVEDRLKKMEYFNHIISTRIQEFKENTNLLSAEYEKHKKDAVSIEKKEDRYNALKDITSILSSTLSMDELIKYILDSALNVVGRTESIFIFRVDTKRQEFNLVASRMKGVTQSIKEKKGDFLDEWVFKQRQCLLVEDIKKDFRFSGKKLARTFRSVISCPLIADRKIIGLVRMENPQPYNYTFEDLRLLDIICDLAAVSLENARLYMQTLDLAITDGLTGLYLRRFFLERLKEELLRSLREDLKCSLLMIDIDDFKKYNDRFGHTAGDKVLRVLSRLFARFSDDGIVGRYGGEEFSILLPETTKENARKIAEDIRKAVKNEEIELRRVKTQVSISIGVAAFPEDAKLYEELILKADGNLYRAKKEGKDRVCS